jgi:AcrR family transcriptional regulator
MPGKGKATARRGTPARKGSGAYHHGALRETLLAAAEAMLEESGVEGFTLRECARRAGVSHGAPAHHFGDVRGLLSEFTAVSFEQLDALMRSYREKARSDAFSQLMASGLAYVDYALVHRARFQLMFRSDRLDFGNERLVAAGRRAYAHLEETMAQVSADAGAGSALLHEKTALAWSIVHGFATLMLDHRDFAEGAGGNPRRAHEMAGRLIGLSRLAFEAKTAPAAAPGKQSKPG